MGRGLSDLGEAEAFFDLGHEALVDLSEQARDVGGQGAFRQPGLFEIPREQQMHEVRRELVDGGLRGQIGAVEVVDTAVGAVGVEEGLFDIVEVHGGANQRAVNRFA